jgi:hypothetical protein
LPSSVAVANLAACRSRATSIGVIVSDNEIYI